MVFILYDYFNYYNENKYQIYSEWIKVNNDSIEQYMNENHTTAAIVIPDAKSM